MALDWLLAQGTGRPLRLATASIVAGLFLSAAAELAHYYVVYNGFKPRWKEVTQFVADRRSDGEPFYAAEGDVPQFYLGKGEADWIGRAPETPPPGAWYAVYLGGGFLPGSRSVAYRDLQRKAELIEVFPLQYGAKNRSIAVFHRPAEEVRDHE